VTGPYSLTIPPGTSSIPAPVSIVRDFVDEPDESFTVTLTGAANATLSADRTATVTILDNDRPPACNNITSLPFTITAQGRYCFVRNLSTAVASGAAITIASDFVVLDMQGFKLGGGSAGAGTLAYGVHALNRKNVTVKNGNIRGFRRAVFLQDDSGTFTASQAHLVDNVRVDDNYEAGIWVEGQGSVVRRSQVVNTGGSTAPGVSDTFGIRLAGVAGRALHNDVTDTVGVGAGTGHGIAVSSASTTVVEKNRVGNGAFAPASSGISVISGTDVLVLDNRLSTLGTGLVYDSGAGGAFRRNLASGVTTGYSGGTDAGGNQ
jgi:hypothetical protein